MIRLRHRQVPLPTRLLLEADGSSHRHGVLSWQVDVKAYSFKVINYFLLLSLLFRYMLYYSMELFTYSETRRAFDAQFFAFWNMRHGQFSRVITLSFFNQSQTYMKYYLWYTFLQPMSIWNFITYNIEAVKISSRCLWHYGVFDNRKTHQSRDFSDGGCLFKVNWKYPL